LLEAEPDAGRLLGLGVDERDVRHVDRGLKGLDAAGLRAALRLADARVLGDVVHALDDDAVAAVDDVEHLALLAAVAAAVLLGTGDDLDQVTLLDVRHESEHLRASETIFMN